MSVVVLSPGRTAPGGTAAEPIRIGLVNNMPDAALRSTERQFVELLSAAADGLPIHLRFLCVPQAQRGEAARAHLALHYEAIEQVWDERFDGLIVTGAEPRAANIEDEPFWPDLARLCDWAETSTTSTIWSCLAAQVAALRTGGIVRRPFGWKLSGVFPCVKATEHALLRGFAPCWTVPQTRYNDLPEQALVAGGYRILSRLPDAGADIFVRDGQSLFVFVQGHPEYDAKALMREYRRDVGRFLTGERDTYPGLLQGYFDEGTAAALEAFRWRALDGRDASLVDDLANILAGWRASYSWHEAAIRLYANWLSLLAERRYGTAAMPGARAEGVTTRHDVAVAP